MAHIWADRVAETSITTGTGALTLAAAITGFQRFSAVCSVNDTVTYAIEAVDANGLPTGDWEVGVGTYSSANTLTRTTVIKSSNANAAVNFAAGTKYVFLDDIASTRNTLEQFSGTTEPSAPTAGLINFAKDFNGRAVPWGRGATGRSAALFPYQTGRPAFGMAVAKAGSTTPDQQGISATISGSSGGGSVANTSVYTRFPRITLSTTTTASTAASVREGSGGVFLRGTNSYDGCCVVIRVGLETVGNTNCRWFAGIQTTNGALAATFDPATAINLVGIGATGTDTANAKLYYNDGAGSAASVDLGANYPAKTAAGGVFELVLWAEASASTVKYHVRRLDDLTIAPTTGSLSTDIPAAGTQMFIQSTINNNATAAASVLAWIAHGSEIGF